MPRNRTLYTLATVLAAAVLQACGGPTLSQPANALTQAPPLAVGPPLEPIPVSMRCEDRGTRFVARGLWRGSLRTSARDSVLRWTVHYSAKHGECDVLVEHRVTGWDGVGVSYAELWDVFRAEPLAAWTDDPRPAARDGVCRLELAEEPAVSCRIAKYFIDDHMRH